MTDVQVENIVVSFSIESSFDLPKLAELLPEAKYNTEEIPATILEFSKPRAIATLFSNGDVVVTGPRSMEEVHEVIGLVLDHLRVIDVHLQGSPELHVQNVTASAHLHRPLNLRRCVKSLQNAEYDKKIFPGVVYTGEDPNTVLLLFDSGKLICNGKSIDTVTIALEKLVEKLESFKRKKEEK